MTSSAASSAPIAPRSRTLSALELLSSMRFAIALLTVICIASAIGTVVKQGEPLVNYVDQFGPYWADVFGTLGLYRIYSTPWFLVILAFLVISTSLCIVRNTPKILADWRTHKEHIREQALKAFHHRAEGTLAAPLAQAQSRVLGLLGQHGWSVRTDRREASARGEAGVMVAARHGKANKLGYIAAHGAIVLICLGGLLDGDLIIKVQAWAQQLQPFQGGTVPENARLSAANPAYRANLFVPEGARTDLAVVNLDKGMLVQPLPFEVELKKFIVEYYSTGMPKRFASEVLIHDAAHAEPRAYTIEVNRPLTVDGVTLFQSSFEDGGSRVTLQPLALGAAVPGLAPVEAFVGGEPVTLPSTWWGEGAQAMRLEVTGLRLINVENLAEAGGNAAGVASGTDVRAVNLDALSKHLGSGAKSAQDKQLVNIGPSVIYKLRDAAGQAREYQNFMVPVTLDGQLVYLLGVRDTPAEAFRYLRVPADDEASLQGWVRLHAALQDETLRHEAARRFVMKVSSADKPAVREQLLVSAQRVLDLFAGSRTDEVRAGGLVALSDFIEKVVPVPQREATSGTLIRILNGSLFELLNLSRERAGLATLSPDDEVVRQFMTQAVLSLSDAVLYPVPVVLTLKDFEQRQASVFQVTRTPGRNVVYLGCILLVIGVFAMLYIRERRLWVWLQDDGQGGTRVRMALSSTRHTLDIDREFEQLREAVLPASQA